MHSKLCILIACFLITSATYDYYRLPSSVQPVQYNLRILTHLENVKHFVFTGSVQIKLNVLQKTKNITLHVQKLTIDESKLRVESLDGRRVIAIKGIEQNVALDYYIIKLRKALNVNTGYSLTMHFGGELNQKLRGYYVSSYNDKSTNEKRYLSVTQFEPAHARAAFPCFDEPHLKATFVVALGHDKKYKALSNMPLKQTKPIYEFENWQWSIFEESVPMSTYLVAFTINDFASISSLRSLLSQVRFQTWARPDAIEQCKYAAQIGPKLLSYYEDKFSIKFPLAKIDQIAVPDFSAGAMENWGLVTYRESALLYADNVSSLSDKQRIAEIIAHELAHQWFGNLVTMKWWTDLWLNEGFATYISSLGVQHINPKWETYNQESLENTLSIFNLDALAYTHPVSQNIKKTSQISESFDSISYKKGSALIRMMHLFMGEETFRAGLTEYLETFAYKNAEQDNLWYALSNAAHANRAIPDNLDMKLIMDSWTLQLGYPLISVIRDYGANTAEIKQMRYLQNAEQTGTSPSSSDKPQCWFVPISYTTERASDFTATLPKAWLTCNEDNKMVPLKLNYMPDANEWIIINVQLSGLYRVDYDDHNWQLIIATMQDREFDRIHIVNRAQLIDDALNLAWSGQRDYSIAFKLLEYLKQERDYLPWKTALENLAVLNRILRQTPNYQIFKQYMQQLLLPIYKDLRFTNCEEQITANGVLHKVLITNWACRFDVSDCVPQALEYFMKWRSQHNPDVENPIPKDLRSVVYCTAIRYGDEDDWHFLWERYQHSNVASEKRRIIFALGCTHEIWLLHRFLHWAFNSKLYIRKQDAAFVFATVVRSDVGYHLARDFLINNINMLTEFYEPHTTDLMRLLSMLAVQMTTKHELTHLKNLVNDHTVIRKTDLSIRRILELVKMNVQWREYKYLSFTRLLEARFA